MKNYAPIATTIVLLVGGFVFVVRRDSAPPRTGGPDDVVWAMFDASRDGKVRAYLNCFTPEMRRSLEETVKEMTPKGFSRYLKERSAKVMGIAISDKVIDGDTATMRVELVYRDKNEDQTFTVKRVGSGKGRWQIADFTGARRIPTIVPYGTEVVPMQPPPEPEDNAPPAGESEKSGAAETGP